MQKPIFLLVCLFFFCASSQFPDSVPPADLSNEESLKNLLDKIEKMKKENLDLAKDIPAASIIPNLENIPAFPVDELCKFKTEEECGNACSNRDLCVQCFKSHAEGLGFKCLAINP